MSLKDAEKAPRCMFGRPHVWVMLSIKDAACPDLVECATCGRVEDDDTGEVIPPALSIFDVWPDLKVKSQ